MARCCTLLQLARVNTACILLHHLGVTVSGVSHSLADVIQCILMNGVLFPGNQVVKSCYQDGCVIYM